MNYPIDPESKLKIGDQIIGPIWVLEYSSSQQAFHVETLVDALQSNLAGFYNEGKTGDYVIIGIGDSRGKIDHLYQKVVDRMEKWNLSRLTPQDLLIELDGLSAMNATSDNRTPAQIAKYAYDNYAPEMLHEYIACLKNFIEKSKVVPNSWCHLHHTEVLEELYILIDEGGPG